MKDTRSTILNFLREHRQASVVELSEQVGLAPVSVHYHLGRMESEGLIESKSMRHGVGRPKLVYSLANGAQALFPQANHKLANRLLDVLKSQMTPQQIDAIFARMVDGIAAEHHEKFSKGTLEDKLEALIAIMGEEGFIARVERDGANFQLTQCGCPYQHVAERHPGICAIDLQLMSTTLGTQVERERWILNGDQVCTFHVKAAQPAEV